MPLDSQCSCSLKTISLARLIIRGGGIWGARGLIGMNFGCATTPLQFYHEAISEAATSSTKNTNLICPAYYFKSAYVEKLAEELREEVVTSPPRKRATIMTEIERIGVLYGKEI
ncbi:unnamed protein product [Auanema sp. JU1783]|nr:unnamed protein product [Auanema sp. JU1783]